MSRSHRGRDMGYIGEYDNSGACRYPDVTGESAAGAVTGSMV